MKKIFIDTEKDRFDGTGTTTYTTAQGQADRLAEYICA